jgi:tRNA A-37 threonylcarbamoyl transferase component Bud32
MNQPNPTSPIRSEQVVFADDRARKLLAPHLADLCRPGPHWRQIKQNASRTVYRGEIDGREIYLKHFHGRTWIHKLRRKLGRSDALRELKFAVHLNAFDVETPVPLAAVCADGVEWLATLAVPKVCPSEQWLAEQQRKGVAGQGLLNDAIAALGRQIGRMHAAGVIHGDLHCGNILMRCDQTPPQPVIMDLHRMVLRKCLSRRARIKNLAQLFHDRRNSTTRSQKVRFLYHYIQSGQAEGTLRGWQLLVEDFALRHAARQYKSRDRRVTGTNRYFTPIRLPGGWRGHVVLASKRKLGGSQAANVVFTQQDWQAALSDIDALFGAGEAVKDSKSSQIVHRRMRLGEHEVDVYIKRARQKRWWKRLLDIRRSRAVRAFELGHMLLTRRIATALPLAAIERRVGPVLRDNILITEAVNHPHLYDFMNTWLSNPPKTDAPISVPQQRQLAQQVLWQLGRMLQQLHDNKFAHRDLKATNICIRWEPGENPEVVLVDLDGLTPVRCMTTTRMLKGLMRLNVSLLQCPPVGHAGRLRMLLGYLRRPGCGRINFKPYWRLLEIWSARKLNQQIRARRKKQRAARR